jgi:hypothetical protein
MGLGQGIKAGRAFVEFVLSDKKFNSQLAAMGNRLRSFGSIGAAVAAPVIAGFTGAAKVFASTGDELNKLSDRTGIAVEALGGLKYAAEQSDVTLNDLEKAFRKLQDKGIDPAKFEQIAADLAAIEDPTQRAQKAMEIFGKKTGSAILPMLKELPALQEEFHRLGLTITKEDAVAATKLGDEFAKAKDQVMAMAFQVGAAVAGPLTDFLVSSQETLTEIIKWIKKNRELVTTIAKVTSTVAGLSFGAIVVGSAINIVVSAVKGLRIAFTVLSAHPAVLGIAAIAGIFYEIADSIRIATDELLSFEKKLVQIGQKWAPIGAVGADVSGLRDVARPAREAQERIASSMRGQSFLSMQPMLSRAAAANINASPGTNPGRFTGEELLPELQQQTDFLRRLYSDGRGRPAMSSFLP